MQFVSFRLYCLLHCTKNHTVHRFNVCARNIIQIYLSNNSSVKFPSYYDKSIMSIFENASNDFSFELYSITDDENE